MSGRLSAISRTCTNATHSSFGTCIKLHQITLNSTSTTWRGGGGVNYVMHESNRFLIVGNLVVGV